MHNFGKQRNDAGYDKCHEGMYQSIALPKEQRNQSSIINPKEMTMLDRRGALKFVSFNSRPR